MIIINLVVAVFIGLSSYTIGWLIGDLHGYTESHERNEFQKKIIEMLVQQLEEKEKT